MRQFFSHTIFLDDVMFTDVLEALFGLTGSSFYLSFERFVYVLDLCVFADGCFCLFFEHEGLSVWRVTLASICSLDFLELSERRVIYPRYLFLAASMASR